jgi:hypothetical protein
MQKARKQYHTPCLGNFCKWNSEYHLSKFSGGGGKTALLMGIFSIHAGHSGDFRVKMTLSWVTKSYSLLFYRLQDNKITFDGFLQLTDAELQQVRMWPSYCNNFISNGHPPCWYPVFKERLGDHTKLHTRKSCLPGKRWSKTWRILAALLNFEFYGQKMAGKIYCRQTLVHLK